MDNFELFQRLGLALAIGLLIGLERGWTSRAEGEGERTAGLRTLALSGLLGGVWAALTMAKGDAGIVALSIVFAAFTGAITLFRYRETAAERTLGATTLVAAMLCFALGAYAVLGSMAASAASAVAVTALLAMKAALHAWVRRITWEELRSGLVLLAMTFILLPLLPNRTIDPWDAINPFELWVMTIGIAVMSFAGYIAMKVVGDHAGALLTGIAGGLASSTAVTVTLSRLAKEHPEQTKALLSGILASYAVMMTRVLVVVALVNVSLLPVLAGPIGGAGLAMAGMSYFLFRRAGEEEDNEKPIKLKNPFELGVVLQFGALLTLISLLSKVLTLRAGDAGAYGLAALSGLADVDAITLSMSRLAPAGISLKVAAIAIAIAVLVNTISKAVLGGITGGVRIGKALALSAVLAISAGALGLFLIP